MAEPKKKKSLWDSMKASYAARARAGDLGAGPKVAQEETDKKEKKKEKKDTSKTYLD